MVYHDISYCLSGSLTIGIWNDKEMSFKKGKWSEQALQEIAHNVGRQASNQIQATLLQEEEKVSQMK